MRLDTPRSDGEPGATPVVEGNLDGDRPPNEEGLLAILTEVLPDAAVIVSPEGRMIHCNRRFIELWDIPAGLLQKRVMLDTFRWMAARTTDPGNFLAPMTTSPASADQEVRDKVSWSDGRIFQRWGRSWVSDGTRRLGWIWTFSQVAQAEPRTLSSEPGRWTTDEMFSRQSEEAESRRQMDNALQASEKVRHTLIDGSRDCLAVLDLDGKLLSTSGGGQKAFGLHDLPGCLHSSWIELWDSTSREAARTAIEAAVAGQPGNFVGIRPYHNRLKTWEVMIAPMLNAAGKLDRLLAISRDVTERREAERKLRESAARLEFTLQSAQVGDWDLDLVTLTARRSLRHDQCFGYNEPVAEWSFEKFTQHVHPDDRARVKQDFEIAVRELRDWHFECRVIWPDSSEHWIAAHGSLYRTAEGLPERVLGIVMNITERKRAEQKLRESEQRFRIIADAAPVLVWMTDAEKHSTWFNEGWLTFVGRSVEEEIGNGWIENLHPDDFERCLEIYNAAFDARRRFEMEYRLKHYSGDYRWIIDRGVPRFTPDGKFEGYIGGCVDIHDQKTVSEKLEKTVAERTATLQDTITELESFSYSISHDLRAPLRAMQSFAAILSEDCGEQVGATGRDYIRRIMTAAGRMDRLIQDVLVFSRVARSDLPLERIELGSFIAGILESYPHFDTSMAHIEIVMPLAPVRANAAALTQCVSNLIGNAIKFATQGKKPHVCIWTEVPDESTVQLFFRDNGIGIERGAQEKIFGMFYQADTRRGGTGIGLAVVRKVAERMGGSVTVDSQPGVGSTFRLELRGAMSI